MVRFRGTKEEAGDTEGNLEACFEGEGLPSSLWVPSGDGTWNAQGKRDGAKRGELWDLTP